MNQGHAINCKKDSSEPQEIPYNLQTPQNIPQNYQLPKNLGKILQKHKKTQQSVDSLKMIEINL